MSVYKGTTKDHGEAPKGCVCPRDDWGPWVTDICPKFVPDKDDETYCANCQHDEKCHAKP